MTRTHVKITFTDDLLGTCSGNPDIHREFIASKSEDAVKIEEEVAALGIDAVEEKNHDDFPEACRRHAFSVGLSDSRLL